MLWMFTIDALFFDVINDENVTTNMVSIVQQFWSICTYLLYVSFVISNSNWTEWSTIQGVISSINFKIGRARSARPI